MASQPLTSPADLSDFPGAPFSGALVLSACEAVRAEAGWHIAPEVTETLTLDSDGGRVLFLPTMMLSEVTEVRDMTGAQPRVLTGWRKSRTGMLSRAGGWPSGFEAVEVDVVHGYGECPAALLAVVAEAARSAGRGGRITQESLGGRSVTLSLDTNQASVVSRFKIPPRP